jgi:hypothetical protein
MSVSNAAAVERWTPESRIAIVAAAVIVALLAIGPEIFSANAVDKLTTLFIYVILALMWNALVGFCGLVSIGQQAFFGLGAYAAIRLANWGVGVYPSLFLGALIVGALAWPLSILMLRLKGGEFAIGMWVVAELAHLLVNLDTLVRGETGTSLIELNAYAIGSRRALTYWCALVAMTGLLAIVFGLLRSPLGAAIQAIRDNEEAAESVGVRVLSAKRLGGDGAHLPAAGLFQPAMDGVHDLHGAGRRVGDLRGVDSRGRHLLRHRGLVRRHGRLVSGRARRDRSHLRASVPARHLGLGRGSHVGEALADRLPPALRGRARSAGRGRRRGQERGGRLKCSLARRSSSPEFRRASARA